MQLRADCNARLRRAVDVIWLWAYDMAMVQFKHKGPRLTVLLEPKTFMPFNPRRPNFQRPAYEAAMTNTLKVPDLKKSP